MKTDLQQHRLIANCKRGDRVAQYRLYQQYSRAMYNICLRMLRNEQDAEDVLQNAFLDVFTKIDTYRYEATIGAWIKRIVINNCINFIKKRKMQFEEYDPRKVDQPEEVVPDFEPETVEAVQRAIGQLPHGYRTVFSLYLLEGYDHKEIGEILEISEATSKSQYSRAKQKIREIMRSESVAPNL